MHPVLRSVRHNPGLYWSYRKVRDTYSYAKGRCRGTYAQHGEDKFILDRFGHKSDGFFVDVGASHPYRLSNTFRLYQRGWRGVTVEPIPMLSDLHKRWRPQDRMLQKAIGPQPGQLTFFEMVPSVLSTLDPKTAAGYVEEGAAQVLRTYEIDVITLDQLFSVYVGRRSVDFFSLDVEGLDADALASWQADGVRPQVICIEANDPGNRSRILDYFKQRNYSFVAEMGCNLLAEDAL